MTKTFRDSFQSQSFGLLVQRVVGVGPVDDLAEQDKCGIIRLSMPLQISPNVPK
jgi:hypothetical protein